MKNCYAVVRTGQDNTDLLCSVFYDRADAVKWARLQYVMCHEDIHVKEVALVPVEEVDLGVLRPREAVTQLNALQPSDYPEDAHCEAKQLLCKVLRAVGPEYAAVADAFNEACDRLGFLYA